MASGEIKGGLALTESESGSDVPNIQMTALREHDHYILNGRKMFITNGENGSVFAVLANILIPQSSSKQARRTDQVDFSKGKDL